MSLFSQVQTGSELVNIHSVTDVNAMNNISSPIDGNLVFVVSENCIFQYNGTNWSKYWKSDGNIANNNDFIGTTNNQDFNFRTNDIARMKIENDGSVGIGNLQNPSSGSGHFAVTSRYDNQNFFHPSFGSLSSTALSIISCSVVSGLYDGSYFNNCSWFGGTWIVFDGNIDRVISLYAISGHNNQSINIRLEGRVNNSSPWVTIHQFNGNWGGSDYRLFNVKAGGTSYQDFRIGRPSSGPSKRIAEVEFFTISEPDIIVADNSFVGIYIANLTQRLHINGNILATGSITSDYVFEKFYDG